MDRPRISLIVPTVNEAENLPLLLPRVAAALAGERYEVIVVDDDSGDDTAAVVGRLAARFPVSVHVRKRPKDGLSGAVLAGAARAAGDVLVVMDADLQHPPEKIPELIAPLLAGTADFVIGSRYAAGGSTEARWGLFRKLNSWVATALARPFAGRVTDPMSGFFALRRETFAAARRLTPLGYKIALELMCKARVARVAEVPIHFAARQRGASKLTLKQQFKYLEHLSRLYDFTFPRASPIAKFVVVTACAWFVGLGLYLSLVRAEVRPDRAPPLAYAAAVLVAAVFHLRYVRTQREFLPRRHPWRDFGITALAEWATCAMAAVWVAYRVDRPWVIELFVIPFAAATAMRYALRKEFMQDVRGLRRDVRSEDVG